MGPGGSRHRGHREARGEVPGAPAGAEPAVCRVRLFLWWSLGPVPIYVPVPILVPVPVPVPSIPVPIPVTVPPSPSSSLPPSPSSPRATPRRRPQHTACVPLKTKLITSGHPKKQTSAHPQTLSPERALLSSIPTRLTRPRPLFCPQSPPPFHRHVIGQSAGG